MSRPADTTPLWHTLNCSCRTCWPDAPSVAPVEASLTEVVMITVVGMAIGWAIVFVLDRLTDGPGMLVGFGL
ncbi:hypothetical protein [Sphingomonas sp. 3-13AW]|uniref:hypothetical protein n=1 Tax=Sphingomonas sp. 3-13AW TaxID=3050450 RepID=UPI003BB613FB